MLKRVDNSREPLLPVELPEVVKQILSERRRMLGWVMRILWSRPEKDGIAEDLVQEAMLKAVQAAEHFRGESKLVNWLYPIVRNVVWDYLRQRRNDEDTGITWAGNPLFAYLHSEEKFVSRIDAKRTRSLVETLPPDQAELIRLRFLDELDAPEIARLLHLAPGAVRVRIHRALILLRKRHAPHLGKARLFIRQVLEKQDLSPGRIEDLKRATQVLSLIDRRVFWYRYGLNGDCNGLRDTTAVAKEFGLGTTNVQRILDRSWAKIVQTGFEYNEQWLLVILDRQTRG